MGQTFNFFTRVRMGKADECWIWEGPKDRGGYGKHSEQHAIIYAHRWSYEHFKGPIPAGFQIDHLCRNRACVNPDHLEAVTKKVNTLRSLAPTAMNARKTHCIHGHPFDSNNTYITSKGERVCRACRRIWDRQRKRGPFGSVRGLTSKE